MNHDLDLLISFLQPIKELLLDDSVSEIMGNPDGQWWFERRGKLEHADIAFDAKALRTGLEVIANKLSRKLDEAHPLLNAQLPDGSRLAAVLPPVVRPNPAVTLRKFSKTRFTIADLIHTGAMTPEIGATLSGYIEAGKTMLISGGTGVGKSTPRNQCQSRSPNTLPHIPCIRSRGSAHNSRMVVMPSARMRSSIRPPMPGMSPSLSPYKALGRCRRSKIIKPSGFVMSPATFASKRFGARPMEQRRVLPTVRNSALMEYAISTARRR
jgi:hypothetical protein